MCSCCVGQAFKEVLKSIGDYQSVYSQCKAYIAGFAARAIAKVTIFINVGLYIRMYICIIM